VVAAIAARLETFLGQRIPNIFHARFKKKNLSPEDGRKAWFSVVHAVAPLCNQLSDALADGLKNTTSVTAAIGKFKLLVAATAGGNVVIYKEFAQLVQLEA
jgi:hypothetical protein